MKFLALLRKTSLLLLLASCSVTQVRKPGVKYRLDLKIEHEGKYYDGFAMLPRRSSYEIKVSSKGKLDILDLKSCDRHIPVEGAFTKRKWFGKDYKSYVFKYSPDPAYTQCHLELGAYDSKGQHSWGLVDFETKGIHAEVKCNGDKKIYNGSSVCQSLIGTIQAIRFDEWVLTDPDCPIVKTDTGYEYPSTKGMCVYVFMNKKGDIHRHVSYGYEQILIRNFE